VAFKDSERDSVASSGDSSFPYQQTLREEKLYRVM